MGNCQASDAASVIVEHPGGKIEKIYWPVIANKVMVSNPGNYVALILTDSVKGESGDGAHKHLKLLRPDDTLLIGHNYRLVSFEEVLMEFSGKSYVKLNKLISLQKAKGSNQEPVQPPNSSSVVKDYRSEEQYDIVLSYQETLDSLTATKENLTTIIPLLQEQYPSDDIERQGSSAESAVKKWAVKLQNLHGDGSAKEPNIARINVVSRYRETNKMKQKISEMEKHLKLFPLIQLELILMCHPARIVPEHREHSPAGIVREVVTGVLKRAAKSILPRMKMVIHFNREVASLKDLVTSITPIIDEISEIPRLDVYPAINGWCEKMRELDEKAEKIESLPGWNVIRRYKDPQDVASLISTIEAHVKSASLVSLEPLFQELQQEKRQQSESLFFQKMIDLESQQRKLRPSDSFDKKPSGRPQKLRPSVKSASVISLEPLLPEMMDLESTSQQKKLRPSAQVVETFIEVDASNDEGLRAL